MFGLLIATIANTARTTSRGEGMFRNMNANDHASILRRLYTYHSGVDREDSGPSAVQKKQLICTLVKDITQRWGIP